MVYLYSRPEARDMQFVLNRADSQVMLSIIRSSYTAVMPVIEKIR